MKTHLNAPCAVALGMGEEALIDVAGHRFNAHEFYEPDFVIKERFKYKWHC